MYRLWIEKALMSFRSRNTWEMRVALSPVPWTTSNDESKFPSSHSSCFCATIPLKTYVSMGIQFHPKDEMERRRQNFPVKKQQSILVGSWLACGWFPQTGNLVVNTAAVSFLGDSSITFLSLKFRKVSLEPLALGWRILEPAVNLVEARPAFSVYRWENPQRKYVKIP